MGQVCRLEQPTGVKAPGFCLYDTEGNDICLRDYAGSWVVLYFYPKDGSPGCTLENLGFSDHRAEFDGMRAMVIGVSPDTIRKHKSFTEKHRLRTTLLSDFDRRIIDAYGAARKRTMFGRESEGVQRSTFIIDPAGRIAHAWCKVSVPGHVDEVLAKLRELQADAEG
ncbi:peroxiredoxin [Candidatus Woesearchaeota archaeon]|nr:peroxiredoxin [Candidatus Woesearchaeota archaeon]